MNINRKTAAAALVKARSAIGATVTKDAKANYGRYATLAAVMEAISPALAANALALVQEAELGETSVTVTATLLHESGETVDFAPLVMPLGNVRTPQAVGSAMTYGRRYQLTALFGLAPDDDDGAAASKLPQETANGRAMTTDTKATYRTRPSAVTVDAAPPVDEDGPDALFGDAPQPEPPVSEKTLKRLHALGAQVYGDAWDGKRHELIEAITSGRTHSSGQITEAEARRMIRGMEAKWAIISQPDYQARQHQTETGA